VCSALRAQTCPSPWMLVSVAVHRQASLLGIAGRASHLGSFTFPPGLGIGKLNPKYPRRRTTLGKVFWLLSCRMRARSQTGLIFRMRSHFAPD